VQDLSKNKLFEDLKLKVISPYTTGVSANGYIMSSSVGAEASQLQLSSTSTISQEYLLNAIVEMRDKIIPGIAIKNTSFLMMLFLVVKDFLSLTNDTCLASVTYEATEIGVVRDNVLRYATHMPYGSYSLSREIAQITKVPLVEAYGYLKEELPFSFMQRLNSDKKAQVEKSIDAYVDKLTELLKETGDDLAVPRQACLHVDTRTENLFADLFGRAVKRAIRQEADIIPVASTVLKKRSKDIKKNGPESYSSLLIASQFFHNRSEYTGFVFN
jgi:hypothetical protein